MAKVIKFALELKNGEQARTIEDLRAHFDLEKIVAYFLNGRLATWLRHRHLDEEADALEKLSSDDAELAKKLCEILGVAYEEHQTTGESIDANALKESNERMNTLRQFTSDPEILAKVDRVAFNEKDLRRLAFDNEPEVYLCNGRFVIPLIVQNKHYIGLGKAEAVIASDEVINFEARHIRFTNVQFDDDYQKIAETENPEVWAEKGNDAYDAENFSEAMKWCQKAANAGNADAAHTIGIMYHYGQGVEKNISKAIAYYKKAALDGWEPAMIDLADMYYNGDGVSQDYKMAMEWYKKAADTGDGEAMNDIGAFYYFGRGVPTDYGKAMEWFQKAADAGDGTGMFNLGGMYNDGNGVMQDYGKAMEWYKKAADAGVGDAMKFIADMYHEGKGVPQDYKKAMEWFTKAADTGDEDAAFVIGILYWNGEGVEKDYVVANEWFRKAADAGDDNGMYSLGTSYYSGKGIEQDNQKARYWIQKAADLGHENAQKWLREH